MNMMFGRSITREKPSEYDVWKVNHQGKGQLNHEGSASSMEAAAAIAVFSRLEQNYGSRYTGYYGDGDSSSIQQVENNYDKKGCEIRV